MPRPSRWPDIVEAAAHAFRERGFAATSLEDIATEVGIWKGSLYHYIDSKEDLLFAVVRGPFMDVKLASDELRFLRSGSGYLGAYIKDAGKPRLVVTIVAERFS